MDTPQNSHVYYTCCWCKNDHIKERVYIYTEEYAEAIYILDKGPSRVTCPDCGRDSYVFGALPKIHSIYFSTNFGCVFIGASIGYVGISCAPVQGGFVFFIGDFGLEDVQGREKLFRKDGTWTQKEIFPLFDDYTVFSTVQELLGAIKLYGGTIVYSEILDSLLLAETKEEGYEQKLVVDIFNRF